MNKVILSHGIWYIHTSADWPRKIH